MDKPWNNESIKQIIKDSLDENFFFEIEDLNKKEFLLTNSCENSQTFHISVTELNPDEVKYFKLVNGEMKQAIEEIHQAIVRSCPGLFHEKKLQTIKDLGTPPKFVQDYVEEGLK